MSNSEFSKRRINDNFYTRLVNLYKTGKYSNFLKASEKFMSYCDNGKKILLMRAKAYRELEMYNEALNELSKAIKYKDNEYAMLELYLLYYHLNMYNEALELLPMLYGKEGIKGHSLAISELVMKKQLGMYCNFKMGDRCDMLKSQIQNYDSNLALEHISDHISSNEDNNQVYFNKNIDLEYLFNIVREEHSLCYTVGSYYSKYNPSLTIYAGINKVNYEESVKLIKECVNLMSDKTTVERLFDSSLKTINTYLNNYYDDVTSQINEYYKKEFEETESVEELRSNINKVTIDEVINLNKKISLSTIYLLRGEL